MPATMRSASLHEAPLSRLPAKMTIPAELQDRCWYDAERRRLIYEGFMSTAVYSQLSQLTNDAEYRVALDDLFRLAVPRDDRPARGAWRPWLAYWASALFAGILAAAAFLR